MLNAFKAQLKHLSLDPRDPFTAIVRRLSGLRSAVRFGQALRQMVLAMPDMVYQIERWTEEPAQPPTVKKLHAFALRYLYHPTDFLSEDSLGFFGYVDDAYVVASVYQRTMDDRDWVGLKPFIEHSEIAKNIGGWIDATRLLIPKETTRIDQMLDEVKFHNDGSFFWAIRQASKGSTLARKLEKEGLK